MKRKINIIPVYWGQHGINIIVRDNHQVMITCLEYGDFLLIDVDGVIFKPIICTEYIPGHYELMFEPQVADKIRIKKYGYSTRFIKIK